LKPLHWKTLIYVNIFWLGLNVRNTALGNVFMPYLVDVFVEPQIKNTALGMLRTAGLIIAMVTQPLAGLLSDRSTSRFGRRRPFIVTGVIFDLVFLVLLGLSSNYWMLFCAVLLIQISSNVSHGPLQGLIPDLVPEEQHGRAAGIKAIFELLPLIVVPFTIANAVAAGQLTLAIVMTGIILVIAMILTIFLVHEKPLEAQVQTPLKEPMLRVAGVLSGILAGSLAGLVVSVSLGGALGLILWLFLKSAAAWMAAIFFGGAIAMVSATLAGVWAGVAFSLGKEAKGERPYLWWIVNRLLFLTAATSIQGFAPFFLMSAFSIDRQAAIDLTAKLMMVAGIFTLVSALPTGWLSDYFGHKKLVAFAGLIGAAGAIVLLGTAIFPRQSVLYIAGSIIGLATGLFLTSNWALGTNLVPRENAGRFLGISNLAGAGAGMIGAGIGGPVADILNNYQPGLGYIALFSYYALLFLLSSISLIGVKKGTIFQGAR